MLYWLHVCICLRLLVWNAGRSHVKKIPSAKKVGGAQAPPPPAPPSPPPMGTPIRFQLNSVPLTNKLSIVNVRRQPFSDFTS